MTTQRWVMASLALGLGLVGCARAHTRIVEMPRVDQELAGNRGVVQGQAPQTEASPRRATRQVIMTDVELMTKQEVAQHWKRTWSPQKGDVTPQGRYVAPENVQQAQEATAEPVQTARTPVAAPVTRPAPIAPPAGGEEIALEPAAPEVSESPEVSEPMAYTVQKGDTLEKIAKQFYGSTKQWPRLYKANRETLKNPNRVYPGQRLMIPAAPAEESESARVSAETIK